MPAPNRLYWIEVPAIHPASVKNLEKIAAFLVENGFTSELFTTSAMSISNGTGIGYTQVRNLLNKPGFVLVSGVGWYYLHEGVFGYHYPDFKTMKSYQQHSPILKEIVANVSEEFVIVPADSKPVEKVLSQTDSILLTVPWDSFPKEQLTVNRDALSKMIVDNFILTLEGKDQTKTTEYYSGWIYGLMSKIKDGSINVVDKQ